MTSLVGEDVSRVTVISPTRRIDLALPGATTLGELLPSIVRFSGYEGGSTQETVHAWVLQRFGEDPLDPNQRISTLSIRDGETLHLRQREAAMPDAAFDDVVDAVTTATSARPSWVPAHSQWFGVIVTALLLVGIGSLLLWTGSDSADWLVAEVGVTAFLSVAALVGAIVLSRALGRFLPAVGLAWSSVSLSGLAGLYIFPFDAWSLRVLISSAFVLVTATVVWLAARVQPYAQLAVVIGSFTLLIVTTIMVIMGADAAHLGIVQNVAAVSVAAILGVSSLLPTLSYHLARVEMPNLPATADALMADDQPVQTDIVSRAITADRILGSFLTATGAVVTALMVPVLMKADWAALSLAAAVSLALLLRARAFIGRVQRLACLVPGTLLALVVAGVTLVALPGPWRIGLAAVIAVIGVLVLTGYTAAMYNKILSPVYGRIGDIFEWIAIMALVPLVLAVLGVYQIVLGMAAGIR